MQSVKKEKRGVLRAYLTVWSETRGEQDTVCAIGSSDFISRYKLIPMLLRSHPPCMRNCTFTSPKKKFLSSWEQWERWESPKRDRQGDWNEMGVNESETATQKKKKDGKKGGAIWKYFHPHTLKGKRQMQWVWPQDERGLYLAAVLPADGLLPLTMLIKLNSSTNKAKGLNMELSDWGREDGEIWSILLRLLARASWREKLQLEVVKWLWNRALRDEFGIYRTHKTNWLKSFLINS